MTGRIVVLSNPRAGSVRDGDVRPETLVRGAEFLAPSTLEELDEVVATITARDVVAVVGGDGTLRRVVTALVRAHGEENLPEFVLFPAGTNNAVHRNLGIRRCEATDVGAIGRAAVRELATLRIAIDEEHGTERVEYGFSVGAGLVERGFREYTRTAEPGLLAAARAIARPALGRLRDDGFFAPIELEAVVDGSPRFPGTLVAVAASVVDDPLRVLTPFGPPLDGRPGFHVLCSALPLDQVARELPRIMFGRNGHPLHRVDEASSLEMIARDGLTIEGDLEPLGREARVSVRRGPSLRVRVLREPRIAAGDGFHELPVPTVECGADYAHHVAYFRERYGDSLLMVVLFGSLTDPALRSATSIPDFFVVVDDYANTRESVLVGLGHRVLPPDLYHLVAPGLASKYYVLSRDALWRTTGADAPDLYVLGRFSKRTALAYARDATARSLYVAASARAALAACRHAAALLDDEIDEHAFLHEVLRLSYRGELRLEDERKTWALLEAAEDHYARAFGACVDRLCAEGVLERRPAGRLRRGMAADRPTAEALLKRSLRRVRMRYPKLILTVDDWIGLLTAKLERTHGIHIDVPAWERPIFLLTGWRHVARLRRAGKIR